MISKSEFEYVLPDELIAQEPLPDRSASRLLKYHNGKINHHQFVDLPQLLTEPQLFVFNNTKVIPARLYFKRKTGAVIEILLLNPVGCTVEEAMASKQPVQWETMIGGLKKWKDGEDILCVFEEVECTAILINRAERIVSFEWKSDQSFSEVLNQLGKIPLPPYIQREAGELDQQRYQTIYAKSNGAVAAPTAGLHFTPKIISELEGNGHSIAEVTLHVGAGTFMPMQSGNVLDHAMHEEAFEVSLESLKSIHRNSKRIAVGTTSLRVMESLYRTGVKLFKNAENPFHISQDDYQNYPSDLSYQESLEVILENLETHNTSEFSGSTGIMISRENPPKSISGLITNFHLPGSTLLVLVDAVIGSDWKSVYRSAMDEGYRFLSYGDSNLYLIDQV
jgi:S-adenosylmethionine:tRNA ribosyltransferase-isomerase